MDGRSWQHRLHYRWSQLEADRSGLNLGSPSRPLPKADRVLHLHPSREYADWPPDAADSPADQARFSSCASVYQDTYYNTFSKFGALKLTEVELFFLSSRMTRQTASEWAVIYLGLGNGERFRYLRDEFFPDLTVIGYDPIDEFYTGDRSHVYSNARRWNDDGTNFWFFVRCFDFENDAAMIQEKTKDKKLLLISDIRGVNLCADSKHFDKAYDNDLQWRTIQCLRPVSSMVKFVMPNPWQQFYEYAPGVILKQVFCNYGTAETRLVIEGVPLQTQRYNAWEIYHSIMFHHEHLRGQVYEITRPSEGTCCLDCCFDCTVLSDTVAGYAAQNNVDASRVLCGIIRYHIYDPCVHLEGDALAPSTTKTNLKYWWDVAWCLKNGDVTRAIATLEGGPAKLGAEVDWADIADAIAFSQPMLAQRLRDRLKRPASRQMLIRELGSLSEPFTIVKNDCNGLLAAPRSEEVDDEH